MKKLQQLKDGSKFRTSKRKDYVIWKVIKKVPKTKEVVVTSTNSEKSTRMSYRKEVFPV